MANRRIHDLEDTATTLDSGAYIAVDSDSYTAAKKFAADKLPDPTGATDGYVWTADGADGAAWEAVSGGASDVTDLTTTTGSSTNMVRVAAAGGLEYRTAAQVLSDIGALAATGSVTGATSSAQTFTNGIVGPTWKPASDSATALQLQTSAGTAVVVIDTTNERLGIGATPNSTLHVEPANITSGSITTSLIKSTASGSGFVTSVINAEFIATYSGSSFIGGLVGASYTLTTSGTGTNFSQTGAYIILKNTNTGTVSDQKAINIDSAVNSGGGAITVNYGLYINNQTVASTNYAIYTNAGKIRFGDATTIIQDSAAGAVPVLTLQQDDNSEDMIEFTGTVGTGNAIEAVGAKTLTTTHFIKCTITGVGNVYIPVGTIA